tara:strand:- start:1538 stop:1882 length:345 start_codon:yes stop_codon:yes gene_type:complete
MAKVKITGHQSGSGVLTITAPNTSTDRTITLPDGTGTLLTTDGDGSGLTGVGATTLNAVTNITVSTSYPSTSANPSATGFLHINKTSGEMYVCIDATNNANVWINVGNGTGNIS